MTYRSAVEDCAAPLKIEECLLQRRSTFGGVGYEATPPFVIVMSAMASAVEQSITVEGHNLHRYSSGENINVTFCPVENSDSTQ
jgi:hypothetical protein